MTDLHKKVALMRYADLLEAKIVPNRTTLGRWMTREKNPFPAPVRLGENSIAWRVSDIEKWLIKQTAKSVTEIF